MSILLPDIPEAECTPLVRQLLEIIHVQRERIYQLQDQVRLQQERIHRLEDEIARLKGLKTRPRIAPSALETPPRPPRDPDAKRPGSAKRSKTADLTITDEIVIPLADTSRPGPSSKVTRTSSFRIWSSSPASSATAANAG